MTDDDTQNGDDALRRTRELEILSRLASMLNASVRLDSALDAVLDGVARHLDLETGWIWLLDDDDHFYLAAARNLPSGLKDNPDWTRGPCYCQRMFAGGEWSQGENVDVVTCSRLADLDSGRQGFEYHTSVPIASEDRRLGILNLASRTRRRVDGDELRLLRTVSAMLATAVQRTRLHAESRRLGALEERTRLARDIHDTLAQKLVAVTMQLETADALLEQSEGFDDAVDETIERALETSRSALDDTRRAVHNLRALPLDGKPLAEALSELAARTGNDSAASVDFESPQGAPPLSQRVAVGLYRIAEEALRNAAAHADAAQIEMSLKFATDEIVLTVADDGSGFDPDDAPTDRFGLVGIGERARRLGGEIVLDTAPGMGTRLCATIPREAS